MVKQQTKRQTALDASERKKKNAIRQTCFKFTRSIKTEWNTTHKCFFLSRFEFRSLFFPLRLYFWNGISLTVKKSAEELQMKRKREEYAARPFLRRPTRLDSLKDRRSDENGKIAAKIESAALTFYWNSQGSSGIMNLKLIFIKRRSLIGQLWSSRPNIPIR